MKLSKTTALGLLAGFTGLMGIAVAPGPWDASRVLMAVCVFAVAFLGVFARDAAKSPEVPPLPTPPRVIPGGGNEADS